MLPLGLHWLYWEAEECLGHLVEPEVRGQGSRVRVRVEAVQWPHSGGSKGVVTLVCEENGTMGQVHAWV